MPIRIKVGTADTPAQELLISCTDRPGHALQALQRGRRTGVTSGHQDDKLVATEPRDYVGTAEAFRKQLREAAQQLVARLMAELIVDLLEAVKVEKEDFGGRAQPTAKR